MKGVIANNFGEGARKLGGLIGWFMGLKVRYHYVPRSSLDTNTNIFS